MSAKEWQYIGYFLPVKVFFYSQQNFIILHTYLASVKYWYQSVLSMRYSVSYWKSLLKKWCVHLTGKTYIWPDIRSLSTAVSSVKAETSSTSRWIVSDQWAKCFSGTSVTLATDDIRLQPHRIHHHHHAAVTPKTPRSVNFNNTQQQQHGQ